METHTEQQTGETALFMGSPGAGAPDAGGGAECEDLRKSLRSGRVRDRVVAVHTMGKSGDRSFVTDLIGMLSDRDHSVRFASADALGNLGDPEALGSLSQCCNDANCFVRVAAREAMARIRGEPVDR
ncbi:MAG: HEAT repeat domain-containing protein [Methanoregulaceae archaeon]|nr:HEAT repeat domain-containing protein [Methanoregulaceae archaeon]